MTDVVDEVMKLTEELETKRQAAIEEILRQRAEAVKEFDEKLAKLGYKAGRGNDIPSPFGGKERKKRGPMSEEHKRKIAESRARNKATAEAAKEPRLRKKGAEGAA
jgi:hypothetical protein